MPSFIDRTGQKFGRWTVLHQGPHEGKYVTWACRCACGTERAVRGARLAAGKSESCGCLHKEIQRERLTGNTINATHGKTKTREFDIWRSMLQRCKNTNHAAYKNYGGRGIAVCPRWATSFENFIEDMGTAPKGLTLDRFDNNKGYTPENCRWVSMKVQANNRSSNRLITVKGVTKTITAWAEDLNTSDVAINSRIKRGWSEEDAVTKPIRVIKRRKGAGPVY